MIMANSPGEHGEDFWNSYCEEFNYDDHMGDDMDFNGSDTEGDYSDIDEEFLYPDFIHESGKCEWYPVGIRWPWVKILESEDKENYTFCEREYDVNNCIEGEDTFHFCKKHSDGRDEEVDAWCKDRQLPG